MGEGRGGVAHLLYIFSAKGYYLCAYTRFSQSFSELLSLLPRLEVAVSYLITIIGAHTPPVALDESLMNHSAYILPSLLEYPEDGVEHLFFQGCEALLHVLGEEGCAQVAEPSGCLLYTSPSPRD